MVEVIYQSSIGKRFIFSEMDADQHLDDLLKESAFNAHTLAEIGAILDDREYDDLERIVVTKLRPGLARQSCWVEWNGQAKHLRCDIDLSLGSIRLSRDGVFSIVFIPTADKLQDLTLYDVLVDDERESVQFEDQCYIRFSTSSTDSSVTVEVLSPKHTEIEDYTRFPASYDIPLDLFE